jgi:thiamine-monophosphate kinase
MIGSSETALIRRIGKLSGPAVGKSGLLLGIGDDCAIFRPRRAEDLLFTTDLLIEDVHFTHQTHGPADIGYKALARGLSDIAAMGGEPRFCLVSLAIAPSTVDGWMDKFFSGLLRLARKYGTVLAGGDLSRAEKVMCDIVVCGATPRGKALRRDGAKPGDLIYVSGRLGKPWQTHLRPVPRVALGLALRGRATAAMDLSDGLSLDLRRLCEASAVAAELHRVPLARGATLDQALHGGEDYELLFTMPPRLTPPAGTHRIGRIIKGQPGNVSLDGHIVPALGYDHFRK